MRIVQLVFLIFILTNLTFSQQKRVHMLYDLDSLLLKSINDQGVKLFAKSNCCYKDKEKSFFSIPFFYVFSDVPLKELKFESSKKLLTHLFFKRASTKRFLTDIHWNIFLTRNPYISSCSDFKKFYCFSYDTVFKEIYNSNALNLKKVRFVFNIVNTDVDFIVYKKNEIFASLYLYDKKGTVIISLSEFNKLYESGEIKRFSDGW